MINELAESPKDQPDIEIKILKKDGKRILPSYDRASSCAIPMWQAILPSADCHEPVQWSAYVLTLRNHGRQQFAFYINKGVLARLIDKFAAHGNSSSIIEAYIKLIVDCYLWNLNGQRV